MSMPKTTCWPMLPCKLPDRAELLAHLRRLLDTEAAGHRTTILHYLGTRVEAEVFLPAGHADPVRLAAIRQRLDKALIDDPWFAAIRSTNELHHNSA
jgi:hypothetical protein